MKRLLVLCFALLLASCSLDDDGTNFSFEVLPVESVDIPTEFQLGMTYPITVSYFRPSTCHSFKEFYYLRENNVRTVAPINYLFERETGQNSCTDLQDNLVEATFNFVVTSNGSYIFKFWQGEDNDGNDKYLTIEVPVIE